MRRFLGTHRSCVLAILVLFLFVAGCGDDDPAKPPEVRTVPVNDVASLVQALRNALPEDRILAAPGTYSMDSTLVVNLLGNEIELVGRTEPTAERPVLEFHGQRGAIGVIVSDGTESFSLRGFTIRGFSSSGVTLRGPGCRVEDCRIEGGANYSISLPIELDGTVIENNLLIGAGRFGINCPNGGDPRIVGNTIAGVRDCAIYMDATAHCERNLIYDTLNWGIYSFGVESPTLVCNNITRSGNANYAGVEPGATDIDVDPLFCDLEEYTLRGDSPCTAENSACGQIGAVGVACAP